MTISYRMLATIVGVVLLFGVGAAFVVDDGDEDLEEASATTTATTAPDEDDEDDEDDEEKDDRTSTTGSSPTTSTTAAGATSSTTAAPGATTTTTRRPGSSTTTTRPPATTAPPTTAVPPTAPPTAPPPTASPRAADLLVHATVSGSDTVRRTLLQVENAGPDDADDLRLTISGAGAPVRSVSPGSGFNCSDNGSTVTCTASDVGRGGRVREVVVEWGVAPGCAGTPALTATVSSSTADPNPGNNSIVPRSLCPNAG